MAVTFTGGRGEISPKMSHALFLRGFFAVVQELGREGVLPYSEWFASNSPFGAPLVGLLEVGVSSIICAVLPPPGDAFTLLIQCSCFDSM